MRVRVGAVLVALWVTWTLTADPGCYGLDIRIASIDIE